MVEIREEDWTLLPEVPAGAMRSTCCQLSATS
jgi:hypothetical protein